jgi:hypothetical protein
MPPKLQSHRRAPRPFAVTLAALTVAAPAATAQPVDLLGATADNAAQAQSKTDLRSPDARDATQLLPSADARGTNIKPGQAPYLTPGKPLPGPPTWPVGPWPDSAPPAASATDGGDGVDWTTIGLAVAGVLLAIAGLAALTSRRHRRQRLRATV